jgi:modulator of FtsH protease HflK
LIVAAAVGIGLLSYYQVGTDEVGVVTRFGAYHGTSEPGLHFRIPLVDTVYYVPAQRQLKTEFGFRTVHSGVRSEFLRDGLTRRESLMLTGDLNVAVVEWSVQYQIGDPYKFLFMVRNAQETLRSMAEATMRAVVGDYSVTEVLTRGRSEILARAEKELSELSRRYDLGIVISRIELKDSAPPDKVKPSFNEVNQSEQERDRLQNEARAAYNRQIFKARGEALQVVQSAEGYAVERVNKAKGEVARFVALREEYARSPEVTRSRIYLETMDEVLPRVGRKIFVDEKARSLLPMLMPIEAGRGGSSGGASAGKGGQP